MLFDELALTDARIVLRIARAAAIRAVKQARTHINEANSQLALTSLRSKSIDSEIHAHFFDILGDAERETAKWPFLARQDDIARFKTYNAWAREEVLRVVVLATASPIFQDKGYLSQHCAITCGFAAKSIEMSTCSDQAFGGAMYQERVARMGEEARHKEEARQEKAARQALKRINALHEKARRAPRGRISTLAD